MDSYYLFIRKVLNMELNMIFWQCLVEFTILGIPEIYTRFNEYLAILANDKFDSLLVCNIMYRGSQQILLNRFFALGIKKTPLTHSQPCS